MKTAPQRPARTALARATMLLMAIGPLASVHATEFDSGNDDVKIRWDNTVKYTLANRLNNPDQAVAASIPPALGGAGNPNVDFGDMNFKKGLINNRIDLLSEFDVSWRKQAGFRLSGAAWYDDVYRKDSQDFPTSTPYSLLPNNQAALAGGPNNRMSDSAKSLMGKKAEFSDAFVYGSTELGDGMKLSGRLGRHTLLYGETLFLGANGIAAAQGPVDLIKLYSLPNAQFKEVGMPVGQLSGNLQISSAVSVGAYYQYEWRPLRLPAAGSYFSPADFVGEGADLLLTPSGGAANRLADQKGRDSGQLGGRVKFKLPDSEVEYGVYAAKYDEKAPIPVFNATDPNGAYAGGTYRLVYGRDVKVFGASFSTLVGETNVAGEISTRRNTPLHPLGDLVVNFNTAANNSSDTAYARGNTLHANLSAISVFPANALWQGASLVGELAFNRLLSVTHNPSNPAFANGVLNTTHTRDAWFMRTVFQPEYFQVLPGLDLQVPIGLGYGIAGRSAVLQLSPEHGGDLSVGLNFDYQKTWRAGIQATHYFGPRGPAPSLDAATNTFASYKQYYADRDFISLSIQRSF
jgi:hypothetical protein